MQYRFSGPDMVGPPWGGFLLRWHCKLFIDFSRGKGFRSLQVPHFETSLQGKVAFFPPDSPIPLEGGFEIDTVHRLSAFMGCLRGFIIAKCANMNGHWGTLFPKVFNLPVLPV